MLIDLIQIANGLNTTNQNNVELYNQLAFAAAAVNYSRHQEPDMIGHNHHATSNMMIKQQQPNSISQCKPLDLSVPRQQLISTNNQTNNNNKQLKEHNLKRNLAYASTNYYDTQHHSKLFISSSTSPLYAQASSCTTPASASWSSASSSCSTTYYSSGGSPGAASEAPSATGSCLSEVVVADSKNSSEFVGSTVSSTRPIHYIKTNLSSRSHTPSSSICSNTTPLDDVTGQRKAREINKRRSKKVVVNGEVDYTNANNDKQNTDRDNQILKAHQCLHCGRSFARSDMLTRHSRLHSGLKPYKCNRCNQIFSRSDHLSTHERTHTGVKPFQCEQCPYSACRRDMITRHMRTHNLNGKSNSNSKKNLSYNDEFRLMGDDVNNNSNNIMEVDNHMSVASQNAISL